MSSDDDIEVTIIYDEAKDCDSWFEKYSEALRERRDEDVRVNFHVEVVQDLRERFWAWTRGIGVYAEPLISLDRRLARHPKIREMVLLLLKLIRDNLQEGRGILYRLFPTSAPSQKTP
ncbi:protein phosphatase [Colletotrichum kahawae]|uniref:Protein phosphatase n=1 Tax=Colletotrichum kahawae TaxID=34407 RepID=A0AAD9Y974_COLKA|nr:protein phosphatase [Colletotrichum kahawae]